MDTLHDPNLSVKLRVYDILAKDLGFDIINNNGKIDETLITLKTKFFIDERFP